MSSSPEGQGPTSHIRHLVLPAGHDPSDLVPVWLDPTDGYLLNALLAEELFRTVWCSSWRHDANRLIGPRLGVPQLGVIDLHRLDITTSHPNGYLWKRDTVEVWAGDAPLCWIDDDFTDLDHAWAAHRDNAGRPTLLIQPDHHLGLQPEHLDVARAWALHLLRIAAERSSTS